MESGITKTPLEISQGQGLEIKSKERHRLTDGFAIIGPVLQQPRQFFGEIREVVHLSRKILALSLTSATFLTIYGAMLGSGHPLLSLNVAIAVPFLFLGSLATCIPVIYLFDVLTGSQRSLAARSSGGPISSKSQRVATRVMQDPRDGSWVVSDTTLAEISRPSAVSVMTRVMS
ncbi:MAG: hypothetical protein AB8I69_18225, partial [Anaerolineae bacterium]